MKGIAIDNNWSFRRGFLDSLGMLDANPGETVDLPHDGMISTKVSKDAPALYDSGYFNGDVCNYTKYIDIPAEWKNECIGLQFDGIMMHASIDVNGCKVCEHHYGYSPFYVDITDYVSFGEENRITINVNTGTQPSSRWYTGSGLYRGVELYHSPKVHIPVDGIYVYTKEIADNIAFLEAQVEVCNASMENRLVEVNVSLAKDNTSDTCVSVKRVIQVNANSTEVATLAINLENPALWDIDHPDLYVVKASVVDKGIYRTHFTANDTVTTDEATALFGIRTITADALRGLRINDTTVKLKGGCLHHDNGLLGAVSLYESEARRVAKLKEIGFNAIRTAHNPPSKALVEACDRVGMYIFDEAFDAWGMAKRVGDFSQYFAAYGETELTAFIKRDRIHPSVIMWSTGNEIPERAGLNNGYTLATKLVNVIKKLDKTRPVSNGICSLWSGLDDALAKGQYQSQNIPDGNNEDAWEKRTEPFTNGLDIVGYNYMEDIYERDHELFPERVILGSENFPKEIGFRWPMVERLPYVIGDFTWTAWDYIGEAGIGKALYVDKDDPFVNKQPWDIMPPTTSPFPWRTANDADYDITGHMLAQGAYRSVVWGSEKTFLYTIHPENFGKVEMMSMWGFPKAIKNWNYAGYENKKLEAIVFTKADEVEILVNGKSVGRKQVSKDRPMPDSVRFDVCYEAGKIEAISYSAGKEVSRDEILTSGKAAKIRLNAEKTAMKADGHDLIYVNIEVLDEKDVLVSDAKVSLSAKLDGVCHIAGFGSGNPITEEIYTDSTTYTFNGRAQAIIRSGYEAGEAVLNITADEINSSESVKLICK